MQVNGLIAGLNIVVHESSGAKLKMRLGQKLEGVVTKVIDDQHALIDIDGQKVLAETRIPLEKGQQIYVQVKGQQDGQMVLQILSDSRNSEADSNLGRLGQLLTQAGLPVQEETMNLLQNLIKNNVPPTPQILRQALSLLQTVGTTPQRGEIIAKLLGENISLEPELILLTEKLEGDAANKQATRETSNSTVATTSNSASKSVFNSASSPSSNSTNPTTNVTTNTTASTTTNANAATSPTTSTTNTNTATNTGINIAINTPTNGPSNGTITTSTAVNQAIFLSTEAQSESAINQTLSGALSQAADSTEILKHTSSESQTINQKINKTNQNINQNNNEIVNATRALINDSASNAVHNATNDTEANGLLNNLVNNPPNTTQQSVDVGQFSRALTKLVEVLPQLLNVKLVEDNPSQVHQVLRQSLEAIQQYQTGDMDEQQFRAALNTLEQSLSPTSLWLIPEEAGLERQLQGQAIKWLTKGLIQFLQDTVSSEQKLTLETVVKLLNNSEEYINSAWTGDRLEAGMSGANSGNRLELFERGFLSGFRGTIQELGDPGLRQISGSNDNDVQYRMEQVVSSFQRHMDGLKEVQLHSAFREPQSFVSFPLPVLVNQQVHTGMLYAWKNPKKGQRQNADSFYVLLALSTPSLGELKVHLEAKGHRLELKFGVNASKVARVFEQNKTRLVSTLEQGGFEVDVCTCYVQTKTTESGEGLPMDEGSISATGVDIKI